MDSESEPTSEYLWRGQTARDLVESLPQDTPVVRAFNALTSTEVIDSYQGLSDDQKLVASLALKRFRNELLAMENVDYGTRPEELFRNYRKGRHLDLSIVPAPRLSKKGKQLLSAYSYNIRDHGEDALAHTCLPFGILHKLTREGVKTIQGAEQTLQDETHIRRLTSDERERLRVALADWHKIPQEE